MKTYVLGVVTGLLVSIGLSLWTFSLANRRIADFEFRVGLLETYVSNVTGDERFIQHRWDLPAPSVPYDGMLRKSHAGR